MNTVEPTSESAPSDLQGDVNTGSYDLSVEKTLKEHLLESTVLDRAQLVVTFAPKIAEDDSSMEGRIWAGGVTHREAVHMLQEMLAVLMADFDDAEPLDVRLPEVASQE